MTLAKLSYELNRQIGLLINRRGRIEYLIVGSKKELLIPKLPRLRTGLNRLLGLRLIHTHLSNEPLSTDDLNDLASLRLDLILAIGLENQGQPSLAYMASLQPGKDPKYPWQIETPIPFIKFDTKYRKFLSNIESHFSTQQGKSTASSTLRAMLVHVSDLPPTEAKMRVDELEELARTEDIIVEDRVIVANSKQNPMYHLGKGKLNEMILRTMTLQCDLILFDNELTTRQIRYIESITDIPLLDRTELILRIFARRANSIDGKLRVELARLKYILPKLSLKEDALSRIRGGIRMRGPGETTANIAKRRILDRIRIINKRIDKLASGRKERKSRREKSNIAHVAIVGYTNAGKSTLLNSMTKSSVLVEDKLFATLDPTTKKARYPRNIELLFSDTVGFIRDLPVNLLDAFKSTLEELQSADLLLHLIDVSASNYESAIKTVNQIIENLDLNHIPIKVVLNKIDLADEQVVQNEIMRNNAIAISASKRIGLEELTEFIEKNFFVSSRQL
ncbi:MAG: GTPase HflX [Nitrospinota bacterium]